VLENPIKHIPDWLSELTRLKYLYVDIGAIDQNAIETLSKLKYLETFKMTEEGKVNLKLIAQLQHRLKNTDIYIFSPYLKNLAAKIAIRMAKIANQITTKK